MFRHYRVILKECVISTLPCNTSITNADVGIVLPTATFEILVYSVTNSYILNVCVLCYQQLHLKYLCTVLPTAAFVILVYCVTNSCIWNTCVLCYQQLHLKYLCTVIPTATFEVLVYCDTNSYIWNACVLFYQQLHLKCLCTVLPTAAFEILVYCVTNSCIWNTCVLCYQQLHLKYLCNLARYWLQAPWGWHDNVETRRRNVIICEIIVQLLVIVWNNKRCTVPLFKIYLLCVHIKCYAGLGTDSDVTELNVTLLLCRCSFNSIALCGCG
jgi:hypothetical protein